MEKNTLKYSFLRADWFYSLAGYREIKASKASDRANLTPNSISFVFASSHTHTHTYASFKSIIHQGGKSLS